MSDVSPPQTMSEALEWAAAHGISLTPADYRKIGEIQTAAIEQEHRQVSDQTGRLQQLVEGFNRHYPAFLKFLTGLAEVLITTSQTVIVAFGAPIVLILLLIVEHSRVKLGIGLFESDTALASFAAWSMVILNTVLEFTIYHVEWKHGYQADRELRGSLRLHVERWAYWFGIGRSWRAIELSPAHRYQKLQRLVTFTILALATAGSMRDVIAQQSGAWHRAIVSIVTDSSLSDMSTWAGGLLFACAAVLSAQVVTAYLAIRSREIVDSMQSDKLSLSASDRAAVQYIMAKVSAKINPDEQRQNSVKTASEIEPDFLALTPALQTTPNGKNGHH